MNSRLRLGPPKATFAQTSGRRMRPTSFPSGFPHGDAAVAQAVAGVARAPEVAVDVAVVVGQLECRRAIDRLRLEGLFDDKQVGQAIEQLGRMERTIKRIRLTRTIVQAASRTMPTAVKTLDTIHLVSATAIRDRRAIDLVFATHDGQQATAARALGFTCLES